MSNWIEGKIVSQKEWGPGLFSLYVAATIEPFIAGQFTQLCLDPENPRFFRPYSYASTPGEEHCEFYYNVVKEGKFTPLLNALASGDPLWIAKRSSGRFIMSEVPSSDTLWMFATGTGLGVFLSLLKTAEPWERFKNIVLVHSVRNAHGLTHHALIQSWQEKYPLQFQFVPVVTGEKLPNIFSQRIPNLLEDGELEGATQLSLTPLTSQVMMCGNPAMIKSVSDHLHTRGLLNNRPRQPGHITTENYWK
jgi:ferredoxin--NADP+ reductase